MVWTVRIARIKTVYINLSKKIGGKKMADIVAQIANVTTVSGNVFDLISGNAYLAYFAAVGLILAAIRIFKKLKKAAR